MNQAFILFENGTMINVQFSNSDCICHAVSEVSRWYALNTGNKPPSRTPLWRQLADALRLLIRRQLALSTRLPGERELYGGVDEPDDHQQRAGPSARRRVSGNRHGSSFTRDLPDTRAVPTLSAASAALDLLPPECRARSTRGLHTNTAITQHLTLTGYDQLGTAALRDAIAARYTTRSGCRPAQTK